LQLYFRLPMSSFKPAGTNYIAVKDSAAAASWYKDKLGLRKINMELDEGGIALGFSDDQCALVLGPPLPPTDGPPSGETNMLYAPKLKQAREFLSARGVNVGDIQQDRQGTHYFEMRDPEGNVIEICEEP
jgi:catechol 2,3-dioxygenase-like lactoylglutathione lyase family enzyme